MSLITPVVACSRRNCAKVVNADDAVWDDLLDLPYCTQLHLDLDKEDSLMAQFDFEDAMLGYEVEAYSFQESSNLNLEEYDLYNER